MTAQPTRWFEYGEPTGEPERFEATIRTTYETGPNESREDDVIEGTVGAEALVLMDFIDEIVEHTHDDGSVMLSGLSDEVEDELLETFEEETYGAEVTRESVDEGREWEFVADVRVLISNPDGSDVVAMHTYKARPKFDDLTSQPEAVHQTTKYWWPDSYPAQGDSAFYDSMSEWEPVADIEDDDALLEECRDENATFDPQALIDGLAYDTKHEEKLRGDT